MAKGHQQVAAQSSYINPMLIAEVQVLKLVLLVLALALMSFLDLKTNRISNKFVLILFFVSFGFAFYQGMESLQMASLGLLLGGCLFFIPYLLGQVGGADVKIFAVVGSFLGIYQTLNAFIYTLISGLLLLLLLRLCNFKVLSTPSSHEFQSNNKLKRDNKNHALPYLPAITIGTFLSIFFPLEWSL